MIIYCFHIGMFYRKFFFLNAFLSNYVIFFFFLAIKISAYCQERLDNAIEGSGGKPLANCLREHNLIVSVSHVYNIVYTRSADVPIHRSDFLIFV